MNGVATKIFVLFFVFFLQGCEKKMNYKPQDFFEGEQLEIARLIYEGNEPLLKQKIATVSKDELNRPAKHDMTLLFWSILNSTYDNITPERLQIITDLVKSGADPLQPRPAGGSSPAEFAMKGNRGVWIKALLDGGLSPNARDKIHHEPIIFKSLYAKNTDTLQVMIACGADINIKNSLGDSLLIDSLDLHSFDHVIFLLKNGADIDIKGSSGWTMSNQLKRFIDRGVGDKEDKIKIDKIKTLLIERGGKWPPQPVK